MAGFDTRIFHRRTVLSQIISFRYADVGAQKFSGFPTAAQNHKFGRIEMDGAEPDFRVKRCALSVAARSVWRKDGP